MIVPITLEEAQRLVSLYHSHHKAPRRVKLAIGWEEASELVACVVFEAPKAEALARERTTWEVSRLCIGPKAPRYCASRLLGAASRAAEACGVERLVSYTRQDEAGTCYRAAGWHPAALVRGREHTSGNRALRWLPGLYEPTTEIVDRVRWERGPRAAPAIAWPEAR